MTGAGDGSFGRLPLGRISPASRARLIGELRRLGVRDERVLTVMQEVERHQFVESSWRDEAYQNRSLPIGHQQTISQPLTVALMTEALLEGAQSRERVLEIGTGSGYQTAVLARLTRIVFSVERVKALSEMARKRLRELGYRNIHFAYADGSDGWAAHAPFDGIIVTAAAESIPQAYLQQLGPNGRLVIPVGTAQAQSLKVVDRTARGFVERDLGPVNFVPLLGGRQ